VEKTRGKKGKQKSVINLHSDKRNITAAIRREQIKYLNATGEPKEPREILSYIADVLEQNAIYLDESVPGAAESVESLIETVGFIRSWIE
jgi:hypothetical protein